MEGGLGVILKIAYMKRATPKPKNYLLTNLRPHDRFNAVSPTTLEKSFILLRLTSQLISS